MPRVICTMRPAAHCMHERATGELHGGPGETNDTDVGGRLAR